MKENRGDIILRGIIARRDMAVAKITEEFKGVRPFASQPLTEKMKLQIYDNLSIEDREDLRNKFGEAAYMEYVSSMEALRRKTWTT